MDQVRQLSDAQRNAVTHVDSPLCILAGAGSGKTRVITHRIAYLIDSLGERPWSILGVTFTNKAAGEMRQRVARLVEVGGQDVQLGTFHGRAAHDLRRFGDVVSVSRSFVIYDQDDAERLMKRVVVDELLDHKDLVRPILRLVDGWQNDGLWPHDVEALSYDETHEKAREAYRRYVARLGSMGALDFGSLLLKWRDLIVSPAGVEVKRRVHHLLVDEYQDTNRVQSQIVIELARSAKTVAVVGDDDQAIYGWRGASAHNLRQFIDALPDVHLVRLEENYRSTESILDAANAIISQNRERLGKTLRATLERGRPIRVIAARDDVDESRRVIAIIQEEAHNGRSLDEVAILYRANAISRPFEDQLRIAGLPYRVVGGVRFYDRKEVKDVLALLRCALNPQSDVDTLRFVAAVPRGLGDKTMQKIEQFARRSGSSVLDVMSSDDGLAAIGIPKRTAAAALRLGLAVKQLGERIQSDDVDAKQAVALAIQLSGIADRLETEGGLEAEGRMENLAALVSAAAEFGSDDGRSDRSIVAFLEATSLLASVENESSDGNESEKVTLMTLHAAKGLEYDVVFVVGLEEHGFPHTRALQDVRDTSALEEERRLAYVGMTRAKKRLVLSFAKRRMVQGAPRPREPSRFLFEIPDRLRDGDHVRPTMSSSRNDDFFVDDHHSNSGAPNAFPDGRLAAVRRILTSRGGAAAHTSVATSQTSDSPRFDDDDPFVSGARVRHTTLGEGRIVGRRGVGRLASALVQFDAERSPKVIMLTHLTIAGQQLPEDEPRMVFDGWE